MSGLTAEVLARLLDQYAAALELYAAQWTHATADVVQESFLELLKQPCLPEKPGPWLYRVVRNRALNARRAADRRRRHEALAARELAGRFLGTGPSHLDAQAASEALEHLPDEQREVIVARIWGQLTLAEIAELVGVSTSTVHRRYEAGLNSLRQRLSLTWLTNDYS